METMVYGGGVLKDAFPSLYESVAGREEATGKSSAHAISESSPLNNYMPACTGWRLNLQSRVMRIKIATQLLVQMDRRFLVKMSVGWM
ncbi:hypothetical protein V2G26_016277 [Clonostachys chloroleuca]